MTAGSRIGYVSGGPCVPDVDGNAEQGKAVSQHHERPACPPDVGGVTLNVTHRDGRVVLVCLFRLLHRHGGGGWNRDRDDSSRRFALRTSRF
jgi:hypothetical protein